MMASAFVIYYANYAVATHLQLDLSWPGAGRLADRARQHMFPSLFWGWLATHGRRYDHHSGGTHARPRSCTC
jgi:hypothetical protein